MSSSQLLWLKGVGSTIGQARAFCPTPRGQSASFDPQGECGLLLKMEKGPDETSKMCPLQDVVLESHRLFAIGFVLYFLKMWRPEPGKAKKFA